MNGKYLFIIISLLFMSQVFSQETCEDIIKKHLETTGLSEVDKEIKQVVIEGDFVQNSMKLPLKIKAAFPNKFRMDMAFNNLNFTKVTNGQTTWEYNPMNDTVVVKNGKDPMAADFIDRWTGGLYKYKNEKVKLKLLESTKIEDIDVYKIEFTDGERTRFFYIDKLSYLILRVDDDTEEKKMTYYKDYKKVDKYYLPHSLLGYEHGIPTLSMEFKNVKLNSPISDSDFTKPGS